MSWKHQSSIKRGEEEKSRVRKYRYSIVIELINHIGGFLEKTVGLELFSLKQLNKHFVDLVEKEKECYSLFGQQKQVILALTLLLEDLQYHNISTIGRFQVKSEIERSLHLRNGTMKCFRSDPSIANEVIQPPVIITGLFRSGTSLLYNLLACDGTSRAPRLWEMHHPQEPEFIPPVKPHSWHIHRDLVRKELENAMKWMPDCMNDLCLSHQLQLDQPEEEILIMSHQLHFTLLLPISGERYIKWILDPDTKQALYMYLFRTLQFLQFGFKPASFTIQHIKVKTHGTKQLSHWLLKTPFHSMYLPQVMNTFPNARIVICHRDPCEAVPSLARLLRAGSSRYFKNSVMDNRRFGDLAMRLALKNVEIMMSHRKCLPRNSIFDVGYNELLGDPIRTVHSLYTHFNIDITDDFNDQMLAYLDKQKYVRPPSGSYTLKEFGLDKAEITTKFEAYIQSFRSYI